MAKVKILDGKGAEVGEADFADSLLVLKKGAQAVHDAVVAHLAAVRAGTASTLRKGEVAGSNKKPWQQKGTGRARAGYRQSPVWRGGGVAFGPHPRNFAKKINKKVARLAFRRAFSEKVNDGSVRIVRQMEFPEAKTKLFATMMKSLGVKTPALFVLDKVDRKIALASRNVPDVEITTAKDVNAYQLVRYPVVIVTETGMDRLKERMMAGGNAE